MNQSLLILTLLLAKHFVADWVTQTNTIAQKKGSDLSYLGLHLLHHIIGTFIVLIFVTKLQTLLLILVFEFFIHGIIDYLKANKKVSKKYPFPSHMFWILIGFDQLLHQLFYISVTYFLINMGTII